MESALQEKMVRELEQPDIEGVVKTLYENYFEGVVAQVCINGGTREDGADVFQESVLALIEKVKTGQFRGESSIKTFLTAIARNKWLYELRTRKRRSQREVVYMSTENNISEPDQSGIYGDEAEKLHRVLELVGNPCTRILTAFYYEKKSMKEILTEFNYENDQVLRNRKSRCMKKLKELLTANSDLQRTLNPLSLYES